MNKLEVNQVGGFPMTTRILDEIQKAHAVFNSLGGLAGNFTIITGCVTAGLTVGDGFVFINGEVLDFKGGLAQSKVIIKEVVENLTFQNGNANPVIKTRYVTFGTGIDALNWSDFKKPIELKTIPLNLNERIDLIEKKLSIFQSGGVVFPWFKPILEIPDGFTEVVDLRGRTIFGYDPIQPEMDAIGKKGGAKSYTLTANNLPKRDIRDLTAGAGFDTDMVKTNGAVVGSTENATAFSILNPYKIALYIEFIG